MVCIFTNDRPIGHGLCGDLVENTPLFSPARRGGVILADTLLLAVEWKWNIILELIIYNKNYGISQIIMSRQTNTSLLIDIAIKKLFPFQIFAHQSDRAFER